MFRAARRTTGARRYLIVDLHAPAPGAGGRRGRARRVFIPGSLVLLACGLGMVAEGHIGFSKPFVDIGLVGWAVSFVTGAAFLGPQGAKVGELVTAGGGVVTEACITRLNRILLVARIDLVILLAVVVNMVVKPGGGT